MEGDVEVACGAGGFGELGGAGGEVGGGLVLGGCAFGGSFRGREDVGGGVVGLGGLGGGEGEGLVGGAGDVVEEGGVDGVEEAHEVARIFGECVEGAVGDCGGGEVEVVLGPGVEGLD